MSKKKNSANKQPEAVATKVASQEEKELNAAFDLAQFAKLMQTPLWVIGDNTTRLSTSYTRYTKEQILSYMQTPSTNEKNIRDASIYLFDASSQYRRLIQYYAGLLRWDYYLAPVDLDKTKVKPDAFRKALLKAQSQVELMNLKHELTKATIITLREGVLYGAIWQNKTSFYVQRINPDYCSLTSIEDGTWRYAVDMSKIQESKLPLYPPEFTTMWNAYKSGGEKYQEVPIDITFCLKADETTTNYSIPPYASTLPMLYDLETYKALQETATKIANYKILGMQIPMNSDGTPQVPWEQAEKYYAQLTKVLPPYVGAFVSPMKTEDHNFEKSGGTHDVDTVSRAEAQFWEASGTSALLHGSTLANTAGTLKLAIRADEELMLIFANQVERLINRILKSMSGTMKFKIRFLPTTVFNQVEQADLLKDAASLGLPGSKTMYLASIGMPQTAVNGMEYLENEMYDLESWLPVRSSYNSSSSDGEAGRPAMDETELDDEGEATRESGANDDR